MNLANRVNYINEPQTIAMAKLSRELAAKGYDVISLSLGEPDFTTPAHIKDAAKKAIDDNFSYYTPVAGIPELREAIVRKFKRDNNLDFSIDNIIVSTGAKHSIMNVIMALVNKGDEVIIPTPYWVSYSEMVRLMEGEPVFINATVEQQYKITPAQLEAAITPQSKAFIFSSPCNPTGSVYSKEELAALVDVFEKHPNIYIIADEIYEFINFVGKHESIAQFDSIKERVITINGLSKGYAMTGWRLGYMAANTAIAKACEKIQSQYTSATSSITQKAAVAALDGDMKPSMEMVKAFKRRRNLILEEVKNIPHWICNNPDGAFYLFPDISYYFGKTFEGKTIQTATDLCMYLLHNAHVSMVTGEAFGAPQCLRISYATSDEKIIEAMRRIKVALDQLI
ncbi:aspartate aminotransferase [Bacteroidetes bacterium UKL13-3]|jgi:aspartate aminotransferase|nr:aspartate aminotransferase [Bacteroidetes bacterium UKL13-3]HCP94353.1 aspartate aminotransferase [Bacteroidota bacterium]